MEYPSEVPVDNSRNDKGKRIMNCSVCQKEVRNCESEDCSKLLEVDQSIYCYEQEEGLNYHYCSAICFFMDVLKRARLYYILAKVKD